MSLVEINDAPSLNVRVFKRGSRKLVLLWNRLPDIAGKKVHITAKPTSFVGKEIVIDAYTLEDVTSPKFREEMGNNSAPGPDVVMCVIDEEPCGLQDKAQYSVCVSYPEVGIRHVLRLTGAGVFPPHEKENREQNTHGYLWDDKAQSWRKQYGVMYNGKFFAAVVIVPCPSCGYDASKNVGG